MGKLFGPDKFNYTPTFKNVRGIHIGVVTVIFLLIAWYLFKGNIGYNPPARNGNGATAYVDTQSFQGWKFYQYNSLGATAGALNGESN